MYIAVDIGGTNTRFASFSDFNKESLVKLRKMPTNPVYEEALKEIIVNIKTLSEPDEIDGIGISMCAAIDALTQKISIRPYHLPDWAYRDLVSDLKKYFPECRIKIRNDAECGALAEIEYGAKAAINRLYFLIMGTGIGGAFVDRTINPAYVLQTEVGYMIIDKNDLKFTGEETAGALYTFAAGKYIDLRYKVKLAEVDARDRLWDVIAADAAVGLANIISIFHPDELVLAGGIIYNQKQLLPKIELQLKNRLKVYKTPSIRISNLGDEFSLYGALCLLK
jgi:predicted NBD/HSP70 family sugar kinase